MERDGFEGEANRKAALAASELRNAIRGSMNVSDEELRTDGALGTVSDTHSSLVSLRKKTVFIASVTALFSVLIALCEIYRPGVMAELIAQPWVFWPTIVVVISFVFVVFVSPSTKPDDSFTDIDRTFRIVAARVPNQFSRQSKNHQPTKVGDLVEDSAHASGEIIDKKDEMSSVVDDSDPYTWDFQDYIQSLVRGLNEQIRLSDVKASRLLDKGTAYIKWGLIFYVASIAIWQVWAYFVGFSTLIVLGMVSCTVAFVVVEFLAAWFLKQYRSFVDSSLSYMRVRSQFNRYMLCYHALGDYEDSDDPASDRQIMIKFLSEEIKWPDQQQVNSNDFNYMLESMTAMTTVVEKLRGVFSADSATNKGQ